jgi:hypothetical protein
MVAERKAATNAFAVQVTDTLAHMYTLLPHMRSRRPKFQKVSSVLSCFTVSRGRRWDEPAEDQQQEHTHNNSPNNKPHKHVTRSTTTTTTATATITDGQGRLIAPTPQQGQPTNCHNDGLVE